jgi:hypothetical protein
MIAAWTDRVVAYSHKGQSSAVEIRIEHCMGAMTR